MSLSDLTNGNFYLYQVDDGGAGIVEADTEEAAKIKVAFSYHKHGQPDVHSQDVEVFKIDSESYFEDCPSVIELAWEIKPN